MLSDLKPNTEGKNNFFYTLGAASFLLVFISFVVIGTYKILLAILSDYNLTALDLLFFTSGIMITVLFTILGLLSSIKKQNQTIAKGVLHILKGKLNTGVPRSSISFGDSLNNLFKSPTDADIQGSISLVDLSNPDNPLFKGEFSNMDEMNDLKKNIMDKMLQSQGEFKGKKMTKKDMLAKLKLSELQEELKKAVDSEDWLWAASIRDEIANRTEDKPGE